MENTTLNLIETYAAKHGFSLTKKADVKLSEEKVDVKLAIISIEDGTMVAFPGDILEVGSPVYVDSLDGDALADGEYVISEEEGSFIVTDGIVSEIAPAAAAEEAPEEDMAEEAPDVAGAMKVLQDALQLHKEASKEQFESMIAIVKGQNDELVSLRKMMDKAPAAESVNLSATVDTSSEDAVIKYGEKGAHRFNKIQSLLAEKNK